MIRAFLTSPTYTFDDDEELRALLGDVSTRHPGMVIKLLHEGMPDLIALEHLPSLASSLATGPEQRAIDAINGISSFLQRSLLAEQTVAQLLLSNPDAAFRLAGGIKGVHFITRDMPQGGDTWELYARIDPEAAAKRALALPLPTTFLPVVLTQWMKTSPTEALRWTREHAPQYPLVDYLPALLESPTFAKAAPAEVLARATELGMEPGSAVEVISQRAIAMDLEGTLKWLATLDPLQMERGLSAALPVAARGIGAESIDGLVSVVPSTSARRSLVLSWSRRAWDQPGPALLSMQSISDESLRQLAQRQTLSVWASRDFSAATQWLDQHVDELPEASRSWVEPFRTRP